MAAVFVTGSVDGLGRAAARQLIDEGHDVVLHARSQSRADAFGELARRAAGVAIGDLSSLTETRSVAEQVNRIGRMDAVIHNAGVYGPSARAVNADGLGATLAVNTVAPTALMTRPRRLIYLSSDMHSGGRDRLRDLEPGSGQRERDASYSDSKLYVTALALALARRWPDVLSSAVDPGWVPTRMGGPSAPDDLALGHVTQCWLAVSNDPAAKLSGGYWHHQRRQDPAALSLNADFQDRVVATLQRVTGSALARHEAEQ